MGNLAEHFAHLTHLGAVFRISPGAPFADGFQEVHICCISNWLEHSPKGIYISSHGKLSLTLDSPRIQLSKCAVTKITDLSSPAPPVAISGIQEDIIGAKILMNVPLIVKVLESLGDVLPNLQPVLLWNGWVVSVWLCYLIGHCLQTSDASIGKEIGGHLRKWGVTLD